jgi:hypothetical protein
MANQRNFTEQQQAQQPQAATGEAHDVAAAAQSTEQPPLSQMSELDRFGLAGLLRMIHSDSADVASLAVGQDLMTLGLDLNQPEYVVIVMAQKTFLCFTNICDSKAPSHLFCVAFRCIHVSRSYGTKLFLARMLQCCKYPASAESYTQFQR